MGLVRATKPVTLREYAEVLGAKRIVDPDLVRAVEEFAAVRNRVAHGYSPDPELVYRTLDAGITILGALRSVPHEINTVVHPEAEVFEDEVGQKPRRGVHAVVLASKPSTGGEGKRRVFPTTRAGYRPGQRVSWEWNPAVVYPKSWYRSPDSNTIVHAWDESMEFVGEPVE
jgi:hypothetical protein